MNSSDETKCRLCLDTYRDEMFELFPENDVEIKLHEKVEICCGVQIRQSPEMPSKICIKCFDMTRIWFNFRQMVLNSQVFLESLCTDRKRPKQFDDENYDENEYLDYLLKELQITRFDKIHEIFDALAEGSEDSDDEEKYYEEVYLEDIDNGNENENYGTDFEEACYNADETEREGDSEFDALEMETDENIKTEKSIKERKQTQQSSFKSAKQKQLRKPKKSLRPPSPNMYMCSVCGNVYNKKSAFTYHMTLHSNVKPHKCELCGKVFRLISELNNHMRRHTGERPYKCSYCDRYFIDTSEKIRHERVHTNSRPYVCNLCGKSFTYSTTLKNHSKLHSGEKDFNCLVCDKSFALQHQLKAHLSTLTHKQKESQFVSAGYEVVYE